MAVTNPLIIALIKAIRSCKVRLAIVVCSSLTLICRPLPMSAQSSRRNQLLSEYDPIPVSTAVY